MEPSAMAAPSCSTVTLTPRSRTKAMSCSTTITVRVRLIFLRRWGGGRLSGVGMPGAGSPHRRGFGTRRKRHADLEPLLLAVREAARHPPAHRGQVDDVEDAIDARAGLAVLAAEQGGA